MNITEVSAPFFIDRPIVAYLLYPRIDRLLIFEDIPVGEKVVIKHITDGVAIEEHHYVYPTPNGYPQFILQRPVNNGYY